MALLNYKKGKDRVLSGEGEKAKPVSLAQYIMHYAYGASEPTILKTGDILMRGYEGATTEEKREFYKKLMAKMENTSKTGNYFLPHGIILSQKAAENVIDFVYTVEVGAGAHVSAGPCICEVALKKYPEGVTEPEIKDLTLYYGADIYENLPLGHHPPVTKEEAKEILADMHKSGLCPQCPLHVRQKSPVRLSIVQLRQGGVRGRQGDAHPRAGDQLRKKAGGDQARQKQMSGRAGVRGMCVKRCLPFRRKIRSRTAWSFLTKERSMG